MRNPEDLSACDGHLVLAEFCEQYPPVVMATGMATKIKNYYRRPEVRLCKHCTRRLASYPARRLASYPAIPKFFAYSFLPANEKKAGTAGYRATRKLYYAYIYE